MSSALANNNNNNNNGPPSSLGPIETNPNEKTSKKSKEKEKNEKDVHAHSPSDLRDIFRKAEKKVLMTVAGGGRRALRPFVDDRTMHLLDCIHRLRRNFLLMRVSAPAPVSAQPNSRHKEASISSSSARHEAEKLVKNLVKILLKVGLLVRQAADDSGLGLESLGSLSIATATPGSTGSAQLSSAGLSSTSVLMSSTNPNTTAGSATSSPSGSNKGKLSKQEKQERERQERTAELLEVLRLGEALRTKTKTVLMTLVSMYRIDFSYDRGYLERLLKELAALLQRVAAGRLTEKTQRRIDLVFTALTEPAWLDALFATAPYLAHPEGAGFGQTNGHTGPLAGAGAQSNASPAPSESPLAADMRDAIACIDALMEQHVL